MMPLEYHYFQQFRIHERLAHTAANRTSGTLSTSLLQVSFTVAYGATPVKKYHSAVPHENSAFKNFACTSLILYCEHISPI